MQNAKNVPYVECRNCFKNDVDMLAAVACLLCSAAVDALPCLLYTSDAADE